MNTISFFRRILTTPSLLFTPFLNIDKFVTIVRSQNILNINPQLLSSVNWSSSCFTVNLSIRNSTNHTCYFINQHLYVCFDSSKISTYNYNISVASSTSHVRSNRCHCCCFILSIFNSLA